MMKRKTTILCLITVVLLVTACVAFLITSKDASESISDNSVNLTAGLKARKVDTGSVSLNGECATASTDFAVKLLQADSGSGESGENVLISPVSVLYALSMTANGAEGKTLTQMENVLGAPVSELNCYLYKYLKALPESEQYQLSIANSIWFTDDPRFTVKEDFLQTTVDYYDASIYKAPFDDSTLSDINGWVENKTDGMIKNILNKIPSEVVMYLVNAMAFDAEWQEIYKETQIREDVFTKENGDEQDVELMYSEEHQYLEDEKATGMIKYYADSKYAFAALLPNEGVTVEEYVASLTGKKLHAMLSAPKDVTVSAAIPKFESEYSTEMSQVLSNMGMADAFDFRKANFKGLGQSTAGNISISRVLHKTFIAVDEKGTKAGAATVVEMTDKCALPPEETKEVILDRPFVYMLIDTEANLPLFIGTMMDVGTK